MGKDRLALLAGGAVAIAGLAAEAIGPAGSAYLTTADYAAGAALAFLRAPLALAASAAWFAGTAISGFSAPTYLTTVLALAYRPPLLLLGARQLGLRSRWVWALWLMVLLPARSAGWITVALAVILTARAIRSGHLLLALAFGAAAATWSVGAMGHRNTDLLTLMTDASMLLVAFACSIESGRAATAHQVREVVIDIGPSARATPSMLGQLRRRLSDPELKVFFQGAGQDWVDEHGRPVAAPAGVQVTYSQTTAGVRAALVHSTKLPSTTEATVAQAAANAASIASASVQLDMEVRDRAAAVSASRARLLSVAEDERRGLEEQLRKGPLARIAQIELLLDSLDDEESPMLKQELTAAEQDLRRLARGLYPASVDGTTIIQMLEYLRAGFPLPIDIETSDVTVEPSEAARALMHFVVSEALANALRHADARRLRIVVTTGSLLKVEVTDDGVGGADLSSSRGLRGLADRLEAAGGTVSVDSPPGGPTTVTGMLPSNI